MLSAAEDGEVAGGVGSPPTTAKKPKRKGSRREKERTAVLSAAVGTDASTPAGALLHLPASHTDARDEKLEEAKAKKEKKSAAAHKRQKSKGGGGGGTLCTTSTSSAVLPNQSSTSSAPPAAALHVCRREKLVEELLSSERAHVHNLNAFLHDYVIPIRDKKILSTDELQGILCNLELIRRWNVEFLNQLESALEDERGFGELFLEMVLHLMFSPGLCSRPSASDHLLVGGGTLWAHQLPMLRQLYAQYNENYAHAMDHYEKCKKNKEFAAFIEVHPRSLKSRVLYPVLTTCSANVDHACMVASDNRA